MQKCSELLKGRLPLGMALHTDSLGFFGTPLEEGDFPVRVRWFMADGTPVESDLTISVRPQPVTSQPAS